MSYAGVDTSKFSQADLRSFRKFRDQHGRTWQGDIENKTQEPCGPLSPMFKAPLVPPLKYIVIVDKTAGDIRIDYERWVEDLRTAHEEWHLNALREATRVYRDRGHQMLLERDPALMEIVGDAPEDIRRVQAAQQGNRWVLGLKNPQTNQPEAKPKWAEEVFKDPVKVSTLVFPNADEEDFGNADEEEEKLVFPLMYAPGRWAFDAEHLEAVKAKRAEGFQGKREEAEAEMAVRHAEAGAAGGAHESWRS